MSHPRHVGLIDLIHLNSGATLAIETQHHVTIAVLLASQVLVIAETVGCPLDWLLARVALSV